MSMDARAARHTIASTMIHCHIKVIIHNNRALVMFALLFVFVFLCVTSVGTIDQQMTLGTWMSWQLTSLSQSINFQCTLKYKFRCFRNVFCMIDRYIFGQLIVFQRCRIPFDARCRIYQCLWPQTDHRGVNCIKKKHFAEKQFKRNEWFQLFWNTICTRFKHTITG